MFEENEFKKVAIYPAYKRIKEEDIPIYEKILNVKFGPQLKEYLLSYGYMGYSFVCFNGINNLQKEKSDMVRSTFRLHDMNKELENFISFEDQGDGDYYLVDSKDIMHRFLLDTNELIELDEVTDLKTYILGRLKIADDYINPKGV